MFSGKGNGEVTFDLSGTAPTLKFQSTLSKINIEEVFHAMSQKKSMEGQVDFTLNLSMQGQGMDEKKKTMNGHSSLQGEEIVLIDYDIDKILAHYKNTQEFGALDIGAFFLAGPLGTAVTKGLDIGQLQQSTGAKGGIIKKFVSVWKIENGVATVEDLAVSTREHRLAVKGKLDLVNETYENITVAVIDEKGCAKLTQKIHGPLNDPTLSKTSLLQATVGPVLSIIGQAGKIIPGTKCEVFYNGSVQHPQ